MKPISVSVIVPVYNEIRYLQECLESVINQTLENIEIVVIDDVSTDGSISVVREFQEKDNRICLIQQDRNRGMGEARNKGIELATGEYIFFLDSDDSLPADAIRTLYDVAESYGSDIVYGKAASKRDVDSSYIRCDLFNVSIENYPSLIYCHSIWNKLIKRQKLINSGIRFLPPRYAEDILFSLRLNLEFKSITTINKVTYHYRWGRQVNSASKEKVIDAQSNVTEALAIVKKSSDSDLIDLMELKTARTIYSSMVRASNALDNTDLVNYLKNWNQVVDELHNNVFDNLPRQVAIFCKLIAQKKHNEAISYWKKSRKYGIVIKLIRYAENIFKNILTSV